MQEAVGIQETFEACLRVVKSGLMVSSLGVYSGKLAIPVDAFVACIRPLAKEICVILKSLLKFRSNFELLG
jgi:threonine dehydrogenase-like Zn-dependent dehydrogenase